MLPANEITQKAARKRMNEMAMQKGYPDFDALQTEAISDEKAARDFHDIRLAMRGLHQSTRAAEAEVLREGGSRA